MRRIILASLLIASAPALATNCEHEADRSFDVDAAGLRTLATHFGSTDLRLRGVPGLAKVEVRARACASDADDLDRLTLNHRVDGNRLIVESERHRGSFSFSIFGSHYAYLDIEIRMPASLAVEVDSGSGDIDARDLANLDFDAGSGDLNVENIAGDLVVLLIRSGSHDEVDGGSTTPGVPASARRMDLSDAIALPLYSAPGAPPTAPSNGQPWLTLGSGEALHVGGATYTLVRSDKLADLWGDLELWLASHTHTGVTTGPGVSGTPSLPAPPGASIALLQSSRIKVDG